MGLSRQGNSKLKNIVARSHLQIYLSKHLYKHALITVLKHFTFVEQKFPVLFCHQFFYRRKILVSVADVLYSLRVSLAALRRLW